ncbi:hypothetical protein E1A91_D05G389900v1 [Gossypium mustelinum]|uniref:Uncharacterized protein n=1 Tax=Gossypium mustelinum TaxID=34275 RepID=A0A5D2V648_GOSMU|nr:hypothetical protein E1A91_D05G389900v1 [Gossypium mustelinum]
MCPYPRCDRIFFICLKDQHRSNQKDTLRQEYTLKDIGSIEKRQFRHQSWRLMEFPCAIPIRVLTKKNINSLGYLILCLYHTNFLLLYIICFRGYLSSSIPDTTSDLRNSITFKTLN